MSPKSLVLKISTNNFREIHGFFKTPTLFFRPAGSFYSCPMYDTMRVTNLFCWWLWLSFHLELTWLGWWSLLQRWRERGRNIWRRILAFRWSSDRPRCVSGRRGGFRCSSLEPSLIATGFGTDCNRHGWGSLKEKLVQIKCHLNYSLNF